MSAQRRDYFRHTAVIGAFTALSRVLGLVRDVAFAAVFGHSGVADAFLFAWRVPNLFRRLFGEGALQSAVVPIFTEYLEVRERKDAWRLARVVTTAVAAVLLACLLLGEALVLIVPRVAEVGESWCLALALTAVLLPYMLFICLTALASAFLNSLRHFTAPALAPVVLNVCWIVALVVVAPLVTERVEERAFIVAVGILGAGVLQLLLQLIVLAKKGWQWRPTLDLKDEGLRRIGAVMAPVMIGMAAFQINVLLDGVIAISLAAPEGRETFQLFGSAIPYPMQVGANSVLYYANRLMQFPLAVFGIALATAIFPTLSAHAARKEWDGFSSAVGDGLGAVLFIGLPAGVGLIVLGRPAVELVYEHGRFGADASARTAVVLAAYCFGLWAYCGQHVLTRSFYSLQDMRTPMKIAVWMVALNVVLNLVLIWPLAEAGLALATAICAALQCVLLYVVLRRRVTLTGHGRLVTTLIKTAAATACMAAVCVAVLHALPPSPATDALGVKALRALVPMAAGAGAYFGAAALLRVPEMKLLVGALGRRLRRHEQ